jgi:hypothetical protein
MAWKTSCFTGSLSLSLSHVELQRTLYASLHKHPRGEILPLCFKHHQSKLYFDADTKLNIAAFVLYFILKEK